MDSVELMQIASGKDFWVGASSSIVGASIIGIVVYVFRNALSLSRAQREKRRLEDQIFEQALDSSHSLAPFAYGIVQARALRYFLLAVFVAYVGDILSFLWPFNSIAYVLSLWFIFQGLRWLYKIEKSAMKFLRRDTPRL
ncbi:MAG TPA: hypothetical protein VF589_07000 [Allosphingosinicella sp.]|jgi:membrane protein YqaA with SNARE-associated domain